MGFSVFLPLFSWEWILCQRRTHVWDWEGKKNPSREEKYTTHGVYVTSFSQLVDPTKDPRVRLRRQKKFLLRGKIYSMQDITSLKDPNNLGSSIKWVSTISFDKFARKSNNYETELAVLGCLNLTALIRCFVDFFKCGNNFNVFVWQFFKKMSNYEKRISSHLNLL